MPCLWPILNYFLYVTWGRISVSVSFTWMTTPWSQDHLMKRSFPHWRCRQRCPNPAKQWSTRVVNSVPPSVLLPAPHGFDSPVHSSKFGDEQVWVLRLCSLNTVLAVQCLFHMKLKVRFSPSGAGRHPDGLRRSCGSLCAALPSELSRSSSRRAPGVSGSPGHRCPCAARVSGTSSSFIGGIHQGFLL